MAVIFDFDGVIADTEKLHFEASRLVLADRGVSLDQARYYTKYLGYNDAMMAEAVAKDQQLFALDADLSAFIREFIHDKGLAYAKIKSSGAVLFPGVADGIVRLAAEFPIAIASGAFREEIEEILDGVGLTHHFLAIVGAGDVRHSKPHPAPYLEAARRIGVDPSTCVAIEDSMWGLDAARAAGMRTIAVTNTYPAAQLSADRVISEMADVTPDLVRALLA
jgi:HAD superfamily hydrolase (TIGR01509 family)